MLFIKFNYINVNQLMDSLIVTSSCFNQKKKQNIKKIFKSMRNKVLRRSTNKLHKKRTFIRFCKINHQ